MRVYALAFLLIAAPVAYSDELEDSFTKLKESASGADLALVKKLVAETHGLASKEAATPAPDTAENKEIWTKRMAYLKEVEQYTEYVLYSAAIKGPAENTIDLINTLEAQNPKSKYLDQAYSHYFYALSRTGKAASIPAAAEKAVKNFPNNEDALLILADNAVSKNQLDRAGVYAERLVNHLSSHPAPEGLSAADWEKKRVASLGRARWIAGLAHSAKGNHYEADKDLRAAMPLVKGEEQIYASVLFYLGVTNYQLGAQLRDRARILEAATFSDQCSKIKGPLANQAYSNAQAMRNEAQKMR